MKLLIDDKNIGLFQCLSSKTRLRILQLVYQKPRSVSELAQELGVSRSITSRHVGDLEDVGLIKSEMQKGVRGQKRVCSLVSADISLSFEGMQQHAPSLYKSASIQLGDYAACIASGPCGLASEKGIIGLFDDPQTFFLPERKEASMLWFQAGQVTYELPDYLFYTQDLLSLCITMELCSEYPGYRNDWPSDLMFSLGGTVLGSWKSPGDFGDKPGVYTPSWWTYGTQYGLLKTVKIEESGTYIDGVRLSDVGLSSIHFQNNRPLSFTIAAQNPGGLNLFGKNFGNYRQDIEVRAEYKI